MKREALCGAADGTVVIADFQTAGRGRMERRFQSPAGKGIYLSALLRPEVPAERLPCVTALTGVAVCDAVERVCGVRPGLKWPNDPVLGNRLLIEQIAQYPQLSGCAVLAPEASGEFGEIGEYFEFLIQLAILL